MSAVLAIVILRVGPLASAESRVTFISQWSAGAEGAAIDAVGKLVEQNGAKWAHNPVAGFTTDMMNKLPSDIIAARPPDLAALHKPRGAWIARAMQVYRVNTMFASKKALERIGATPLPRTCDEFNAMAEKMKAASIAIPLMHGGTRSNETMHFEMVLATMDPAAYRRAIMELDDEALRGPEVLAALRQLRRMTSWMSPSNTG